MRTADLTTGAGQLRDAFDVLERAWLDAREHWRDANSRTLEEQYLRPLAARVAAAFPAIRQLATVLAQAERECGPW
jgi:CHAD domain-containing protein